MIGKNYLGIMKKTWFLILSIALFFPNIGLAYNKSWDQGHVCCNPSGGASGWGKYDYEGVFHGGYTSKECCELLCKICSVYANTGRLQKTFTDLTVPGVGPSLTITRTYISQDWATSLLGHGWMFNFGKKLVIMRNKQGDKIIVVRQETGELNFFKEHPDGTLELLTSWGITYDLTKNPDGTYTVKNRDGSQYDLQEDGKISKIIDKNGNELAFEYNSVGCLSKITNQSGNYVDFQLGPNGKIASISDNLGRTVSYGYDENGNVTSFTDPMGNTTQYVYDSENRLIRVIDPRGNTVFAVTYDNYQPSRVATFTEKGETWTITYYSDHTVKRDSQGNTWTYYFNELGIIEKVIDPLGNVVSRNHNKVTSTSVDWEEDANGNRTTYTWDANGNITSKTDPLGNTTAYTYVSGTNLVATETNPLGIVTKYEYDAKGNQTKIIRDFGGSLENITTYAYDSKGNQTSITDSLGHTTSYEYDANGNLIKVTDPLGNVTTYTYDSRGNRLTETDANGNTTTYTYDLMDRLVSVTDTLGNTTTYTYDGNGNRLSETDANGNTRVFTYDAYNRLAQETDPLGNTTSYTYDSRDNLISMTDANGNTTAYTYDILDRLIRETNALGGQTNYTYDAVGNILTITDANGNTTTFTYDADNRRISETNAAGERITYVYDANGKMTGKLLPNGNMITFDYDNLGRLQSVSDSIGNVLSYSYDPVGNVIEQVDAKGNKNSFMYDALRHMLEFTDKQGNNKIFTYDSVGNLMTQTDRNGNQVGYSYDAINRIISVTDKLGNVTQYSYDKVSNLTTVQDKRGNITTYDYDNNNRLIQENYVDGTIKKFTYDGNGNRTSRIDQNGNTTVYTYDALNRLTKIDYPGLDDNTYSYDYVGNLLTSNNQSSNITRSYDTLNRMIQSMQNGKTIQYFYDVSKRVVTYPNGLVITEEFDVRDRLSKVKDASLNAIIEYTYDATNLPISAIYLNGCDAAFSYSDNSWLTNLSYTKNTNQFIGFQYKHDQEGNVTSARNTSEPAKSEQYIYDNDNRLIQFKVGIMDALDNIPIPVTQTAYNLDALGNWLSKTTDGVTENRTHNEMNEIIDIDGVPHIYDDNGNLIDDGINTYEYDYENRLLRVTRKSDSVILGEYKYDALGRRVEKIAGSDRTNYYYDQDRVLEEWVNDSYQVSYIYGAGLDEIISMERSGQSYYYHQNYLGSVLTLTDNNCDIVETYSYDAYGAHTIFDAAENPLTNSISGNPYFFTGRRYDSESGLQYNRRRFLSYKLGRWLTHDPLGYIDSGNLYEYLKSNPVNYVDPFGEAGKEICCVKTLTVTHIGTSETKTTARQHFTMVAEYEAPGTKQGEDCCSPKCCAFRQDIKGYWKLNGVKQTLRSSGSGLIIKESTYVDDGYRNADDYDSSDTRFETSDSPGGGFKENIVEDYYLNFRAKIIDTCNGNKVVKEKTGYWIRIEGKYPRTFTHGGF